MLGTINDNIIDSQDLAVHIIDYLKESYPGALNSRYDISEDRSSPDILTDIAINRKALKKGEEPDTEKAAYYLTDDLRSGRLGRISLELPG